MHFSSAESRSSRLNDVVVYGDDAIRVEQQKLIDLRILTTVVVLTAMLRAETASESTTVANLAADT